jgi:hypothetical protein
MVRSCTREEGLKHMSKKVELRVVGGCVMADDKKKKAERNFNLQALNEAVERMQPELAAASEAAHKLYGADDTPEDSDIDRMFALGCLVDSLDGLSGTHLWVLREIADALYELHAADSDHREKTPHHHH